MSSDAASVAMTAVFVLLISLQLLVLHLFGEVKLCSADKLREAVRCPSDPARTIREEMARNTRGPVCPSPAETPTAALDGGAIDALAALGVLSGDVGGVAAPQPVEAFRARRCVVAKAAGAHCLADHGS
mmetsp:Transcript_75600/g.211922  ORF Transcript_75600/g.211922 Transcript_75600/m.211922 type:complete len:129 (-) Transcript_75600:613-999(-)